MIVSPRTLVKSLQNTGSSPTVLSHPSSMTKLKHFWYAADNRAVRNIGPQRTYVSGTFGTGVNWRQYGNDRFMLFDDTGTGGASNAVVTVGDSAGTGAPTSNFFTFLMKVNLSDVANYQTLYGSGTSSALFRINTSSQLELVQPGVALIANSTGTLAANKTYVVGVTYTGSSATFYINGVAAGSGSSTNSFIHGQQYFIGAEESTGTTRRITNGGKIAYLAVWDKALSAGEMAFYSKNIESLFAQSPFILANSVAAAATTYAKTQAFVSC